MFIFDEFDKKMLNRHFICLYIYRGQINVLLFDIFLIDIDQQYVINFSDFKSLNNRKDKESRKITEKVSLILIVSISISVNAD